MGKYDDVANITMMKERTGADKVFYLGWSQGTIQMFYGLSYLEESFFADSLHKFVFLGLWPWRRAPSSPKMALKAIGMIHFTPSTLLACTTCMDPTGTLSTR